MLPFLGAFVDELEKVAGVTSLLRRLSESPALRKSVRHAALLGGGTGAVAGALSHKNEDESRLRKILGGATLGALTGGITGAVHPGWYSRESRFAVGERGH